MDEKPNSESSIPEKIETAPDLITSNFDHIPLRDNAPQSGPSEPPQYAYAQTGSQTTQPYYQPNDYQAQRPYQHYQPQQQYQQQYNAQPQYNYPPNQYPPQYVNNGYYHPARGKATASLVLGIISLVFCWMSFFAIISVICAIIGIVLGNTARKQLTPEQGSGQATAGMICSIIGLVLGILLMVVFTVILVAAVDYTTDFGPAYSM